MTKQPPMRKGWRCSRYGFAAAFVLSLLIVFTVVRVVLFFAFPASPRPSSSDIGHCFAVGTYRYLFVAVLFSLPLLAWFCVLPERWFSSRWHRIFLSTSLILSWTGL